MTYLLALALTAAEPRPDAGDFAVASVFIAGAYGTLAYATRDDRWGQALATTGGLAGGALSGLVVGSLVANNPVGPGSVLGFFVRPVLGALLGAALGTALGFFGSSTPGAPRWATHATVGAALLVLPVSLMLASLRK